MAAWNSTTTEMPFAAGMGGGDGIMCGIARHWARESLLLNWVVIMVSAGIFVLGFSGTVFYKLYWPSNVTYEKWRWKTNPKFPTPEKVRDEIVQTFKGMGAAAICPALALWLYGQGEAAPVKQYGYCGTTPEYGYAYNFLTFLMVWIGGDFWEFFYHRLGHSYSSMWQWHRHHHVFFNPSPFSVVADEFVDQFFRALPLVLFPIVMPTNLDVLWFTFSILFYGTGVYHHSGYELKWPNAHTGFFNTSYHHYLHHSISINKKPYHCGFFFQAWDQLFGCMYKGNCFCVQCSQAKGLRSREKFAEVVVPDYTVLLRPSFWLSANLLAVISGTSAEDTNEELKDKEALDVTLMQGLDDTTGAPSTTMRMAKAD
jgi:lathosterol oxidase